MVARVPGLRVKTDGRLAARLANGAPMVLDIYVILDVNVYGILAQVKAYIIPVEETYDLTLALPCSVRLNFDYGTNVITIQGTDDQKRQAVHRGIPVTWLFPLE